MEGSQQVSDISPTVQDIDQHQLVQSSCSASLMNQDAKENKEEDNNDDKILSHAELKKFFQEALSHLLESDPLLSDLHPQVTLEEVKALNELEHGRAMKVYVERADGGMWGVVVPREATVRDLKEALRKHVALALARQGVRRKVSWRYVWKSYWLASDGETLKNDNAKLLEVGVRHKSSLTFIKRHREKYRKQLDRGGR